mgnify:FL=1
MSKRFRLDFSTAYGQLILLVFLPISALALTGGFLVLSDTSRAARTIQKSTADSLLVTFQPVAAAMQTSLLKIDQGLRGHSKMSAREVATLQSNVKFALQNAVNNRHLQGMAIVNEQNQVLVSFGDLTQQPKALLPFSSSNSPTEASLNQIDLLSQLNTQDNHLFSRSNSTLYGQKLALVHTGATASTMPPLWLVVNIDNEPLQVARYQVMLALAITG